MAHLGNRVSALLDGQLGAEEEERAWAHVHGCHTCRDQVEREGWVKTRLVGLSLGGDAPSTDLKGSLVDPAACADRLTHARPAPRRYGMAALGGGALGAAFLGVLALTAGPAGPGAERRPPASTITTPVSRAPANVSQGAVTVLPVADRLGPHRGQAGVAGVRMDP